MCMSLWHTWYWRRLDNVIVFDLDDVKHVIVTLTARKCCCLAVSIRLCTESCERGVVPAGRFLGRALYEETYAQVYRLFANL
jgi:hypothetical protein